MLTARENAGAVLLGDGRVFVAGGDDDGAALSSAELYDPDTGTWSAAAPLTHPRESPGIALLNDGKVLVAGGITGGASGTPVQTSQVYDPVANPWGPAGDAAGDFALASDSCTGAPVAPGAACAFGVTFAPSAGGARAATLTVAANTAGPSRAIALSGNGVAPPAVTPAATPVPPAAVPPAPTATRKRFAATLAFTFRAGRRATKLISLSVRGLPAGTTVVARCSKGCAHKQVTKRNASRTVSLKALVKKALKVGTRITVTISRPGYVTQVKTLIIRAHRAPKIVTR